MLPGYVAWNRDAADARVVVAVVCDECFHAQRIALFGEHPVGKAARVRPIAVSAEAGFRSRAPCGRARGESARAAKAVAPEGEAVATGPGALADAGGAARSDGGSSAISGGAVADGRRRHPIRARSRRLEGRTGAAGSKATSRAAPGTSPTARAATRDQELARTKQPELGRRLRSRARWRRWDRPSSSGLAQDAGLRRRRGIRIGHVPAQQLRESRFEESFIAVLSLTLR